MMYNLISAHVCVRHTARVRATHLAWTAYMRATAT
jgi:hypothetical protein